jgi:hypothetical protein
VLDNKSGEDIEIVGSQTFLVDDFGGYWNIIPTNVAIDRLEKSTQLAAFFGSDMAKGAVLGAVGGSIIGAVVGIVSGRNVGSAIGTGAAIGAGSGAVIGGVKGGTDPKREYRITEDLRQKSLEGKVIPNEHLGNGFIFFPGEAKSARELRLQYREKGTGQTQTVMMRFK